MSIHATALLHPEAQIGSNVSVGAFAQIGAQAVIGDNSVIGSRCEIGLESGTQSPSPLIIGANTVIRSGSTFYNGSTFGDDLQTGHNVIVRESTTAGRGLQIGTNSDIQGCVEIGNYVKTHSRVFIPQHTIIHDYVWLFPGVILTDDPHPPSEVRAGITIKSFAALAAGVTVLPGLVIEKGCLIAAGSTLTKNTSPDTVWVGNPAKCAGTTDRIRHKEKNMPAYPWRKHFHRGYPDEITKNWSSD